MGQAHSFRGSGGGDRRRAILDAALAAFDAVGYEDTTIAAIRERSGASTGSIYHHFESKEGIAGALYEEAVEHYRSGLLARVDAIAGARDLVRAVVLYHLEWAVQHPAWARYLLRMRHTEGVLAREDTLRRGTRDFLERMQALLQPHVEQGRIVRLPAALYPLVIIGPTQDMIRDWLAGRLALDPRAVADTLADLAWKALRTDAR
ncbi:MAG: TetR/AcrR family transcriptional regulator [Myxococcota bacterium]